MGDLRHRAVDNGAVRAASETGAAAGGWQLRPGAAQPRARARHEPGGDPRAAGAVVARRAECCSSACLPSTRFPSTATSSTCIDGRHHLLCYSRTCLRGLLARAQLAMTASLEGPELDAVTKGQPLRLRLVATRGADVPPVPSSPLVPALNALAQYHRAHGFADRVRSSLPVRVRGALLDRAVERRARERRHAVS